MIPPLIELLEIETAEVAFGNSRGFRHGSRLYPAEVLKRFQFPLPVIAARLAPALVSPDAYVRAQALAVLLDAAGPPGAAVTPEPVIALLLALLADVDPRNRLRAAEILARLAPDARRRAGAVLLGQLGDPPDCWALLATVSLARFEPEARTAAAILAGRLDASDRNARCTGLYLLGRLGPPARSAVPAIVRAMVTPDAGEQWPQLGLGGLSPLQDVDRPWDHIGVLPAGNGSDSPSNLAAMAALVLGRIGPEAGAEAVALLIGMVREGGRGPTVGGGPGAGRPRPPGGGGLPGPARLGRADDPGDPRPAETLEGLGHGGAAHPDALSGPPRRRPPPCRRARPPVRNRDVDAAVRRRICFGLPGTPAPRRAPGAHPGGAQ